MGIAGLGVWLWLWFSASVLAAGSRVDSIVRPTRTVRVEALQVQQVPGCRTQSALGQFERLVEIGVGEVSPSFSPQQMVERFIEGRLRDSHVRCILIRVIAAPTFGNVRWRRSSRIANLVSEPEIPPDWPAFRHPIHQVGELSRQLPADQVSKIVNSAHASLSAMSVPRRFPNESASCLQKVRRFRIGRMTSPFGFLKFGN